VNSTEVACGLRASASKSPPHLQGRIEAELICKQLLLCRRTAIGLWANHYSFRIRMNSRSDMKPLLIRGQTTIAVALTRCRFAHILLSIA